MSLEHAYNKIAIIEILGNNGALRSFDQHPGQFAVHDADDNPVREIKCSPAIFNALNNDGVLAVAGQAPAAPHYAGSYTATVYRLKEGAHSPLRYSL